MIRLRELIGLLIDIGHLALVLFLLLIAREIWKVVSWTGTAQ